MKSLETKVHIAIIDLRQNPETGKVARPCAKWVQSQKGRDPDRILANS